MPAKQKQVPAGDMAMPAPHFAGTSAMPAKHKQVPAADMAMPAPQLFQYARDACKTQAGACSRHGEACAPFWGDEDF